MPIRAPNLDDRSYEEFRDELVARIPVHNPEWTDSIQSDPGVTLLELFDFLAENLGYRPNLIPEGPHDDNRRWLGWLIGALAAAAAALLLRAARQRCRCKRPTDDPVPPVP